MDLPEYAAWCRREATIGRLQVDVLEAIARDPHGARVRAEVDEIFTRAEELRNDPNQQPTGPFAREIAREVKRLMRRSHR